MIYHYPIKNIVIELSPEEQNIDINTIHDRLLHGLTAARYLKLYALMKNEIETTEKEHDAQ